MKLHKNFTCYQLTFLIVLPLFQADDLSTLHSIGTAAVVVQVTGTNWPKPAYTLLVTGLCRFRLEQLLQETPYPIATVTQLDKLTEDQGTCTCLYPHYCLIVLQDRTGKIIISTVLI